MSPAAGFNEAIAFARDLIRIPGLSGAEGDVAERVRVEMERLAFDDVWVDGLGSVFARVKGRGSAPAVMLSCHLDSVDVGDPAGWEHDPFSGDVEGGWLHGRGAMDIKGPLALQTHAAALFLEHRPEGDILVAHTVMEERGGWGMAHAMDALGGEIGAAIIGEATRNDICIGHRGRAELIVEVHGLAGHASAPERAHNPIALLPSLIPALATFAGSLESDDVLGPSTIAPTAIETTPRSYNVIPDRVRVVLDWRLLPGLQGEEAVARVEDHLRDAIGDPAPLRLSVRLAEEVQVSYTGEKSTRPLFTPGFMLAPDHPVAVAAADAVARHTGDRPDVRPWTFATDGGYTAGVHGIPTIGFAPGDERYAHTNIERLELSSARVAFDAYGDLITAVQRASGGLAGD